MGKTPIRSILAADFGSANTRALLFAAVDGQYRLVAQGKGPSTIAPPRDNARLGLSKILREIGAATGRTLLDAQDAVIRPQRDGSAGVDVLLCSASGLQPLRAALIGLYPQHSIAAVKRAIAPFYLDIVAEAHLEDGLSARGRLNRIVQSKPQLLIITGGTDGGARAVLLEMLSLARQALALLPRDEKPALLYAGNSSLTSAARQMLSQRAELHIAPNIRHHGGERREPLQAALQRHFAERLGRSPRFRHIDDMCEGGIQPTARGLETMTAFFSRMASGDVLAIDIGSARSQLAFASRGEVVSAVRSDIGLGHSAASTLDLMGADALRDWLPFHPRKGELARYARDKRRRFAASPLDMRERYLEFALLRASLHLLQRQLAGALPGTGMQLSRERIALALISGGAFLSSGQGALDMLLLADALLPEGIMQVKADPYGALSALGTLASIEPTAVVQLLGGKALQDVGYLIRASGSAPAGATVMNIKLQRASGAALAKELKAGEVWRLPLPAGESAELQIQMRRGAAIGGKRRLQRELRGGRGGLLFDARLDALPPSASVSERAVMMLRWLAAVTGREHPVAIPEDWLALPG